jgi:hypothetical protein
MPLGSSGVSIHQELIEMSNWQSIIDVNDPANATTARLFY